MPLRPTTKNQENRPISAIYIGKGNLNHSVSSTSSSTTLTQPPPFSAPAHIAHHRKSSSSSVPPGLPDLPEPPSPVLSNSSAGSGLPSPPATNSTGSGSTGNTGRIAVKNGAYDLLDGDVADDLLDEDTTARMRLDGAAAVGRHAVAAASSENVAALARVKTLAERNRQALDKLTSMARLASPSPSSVSTRHSRTSSTAVSVHSSSSSQTTSSRPSRPHTSYLPPVTPSSASQDQVLSGSETEKESTPSLYAYHPNNSSPSLYEYASYPLSAVSSSSSSSTPHSLRQTFSTNGYGTSHAHTPSNRPPTPITHQTMQQQQSQPRSKHHRIASLASASTSHLPPGPRVFQTPPSQAQQLSRTRSTGTNTPGGSSGGTASTNRMRQASASSVPSYVGHVNGNVEKPREDGSTSSNSPRRRRPGSTNMQGTILPEDETEPMKLRRRNTVKAEDKDVAQAALAAVASSRSKTSLDSRKRGTLPKEFRHEVLVEDNYAPHDPITPYRSKSSTSREVLTSATSLVRERNPSLRGGSAESALTTRGLTGSGSVGGRSVVSEVLKAVGLSPRRDRRLEREKDNKRESRGDLVAGDVFRDHKEDWSPEVARPPISEFGERRTRVRESESERMEHLGSRSVTSLSQRRYASRSRSRARTGVGEFSDEEDSDDGGGLRQDDVTRTAPAGLRAYRHTYFTPRDAEREVAHLSLMKKEKEREWEREKERALVSGRSMTSLSKYSTSVHQTLAGPSSTLKYSSHASSHDQERERAASRQSALASIERTEHVRLMTDSLAMFEGHVSRISSSADGGSFNPAHIFELVRTAESVVASADRLNGALRAASKHAVEQEIDAEVADDMEVSENGGRRGTYSARDTAKMWKAVSADYKEGVKASDELVRGITTFMLGIGKFLRDVDTLEGAGDRYQASENGGGSIAGAHARSVSLNDEDIIRSARGISPALSGGSSGRDASRRSVDFAKKGWEPSPLATNAREEALRRLTERSDGAPSVRTSSSVLSRDRDQDVRYESHSSSRHNSAFMTPAPSRSSTAFSTRRSHREQEPQHRSSRLPPSESEDILASTSQDTITPYEPSPSPAPRIRDTSDRAKKDLPPLRTSRPLPSVPSESSLRRQDRAPDNDQASVSELINKMHERRKASQTSISTIRGVVAPVSTSYPAALNPSGGGATTAVTTHTVSNTSPEGTPVTATSSSIQSSESRRNLRSNITFSKPSTESVPTLAVLQQQHEERQRTTATSLGSVPPTPMSGSETERPPKRRTWGVRTGLKGKTELESFEDSNDRVVLGRAADRSAAAMSSVPNHMHSLKRRAVTELFPAS
ncbi:hypothetical protein M378DRAFT_177614 [Amanita muscaria Koide BX008]|uniref:Uncharacterized protein n=1 Tax=Amanita muscaria (strain Koide BX008) TaxID=946122 RepID=A0A0C2XD46_AMAMK|nr:hypothetical protein M378DRAFT_177614 [Amanita muscaria Koide BX008]